MKKTFLLIICIFLINACSEPDFDTTESNNYNVEFKRLSDSEKYDLNKKFAKALHEAMLGSSELRSFLKEEALVKFNKDYDILYNYVKGKRVGQSTFRDILLQYFDDEEVLIEIETQIPSLTIFVPKLPNNSFSAENWNTDEQVPLVAIRLLDNDKTPIISSNSESYLLDHNLIPGFPVLVVKENERIVVPGTTFYDNLGTREYRYEGFSFKFMHINFNGLSPEINITINGPIHLVEAWEAYGKEQNLGWHRDYIYYGLQPNSENGPFINDYKEFVRDFKIEGDTPWQALSNISQPSVIDGQFSDPELIVTNGSSFLHPEALFSQGSFWTDGNFDFEIKLYYHEDATPLLTPFDASPESLFEIEYSTQITILGNSLPLYTINDIRQKTMELHKEMINWQLHNNNVSNKLYIDVEEMDSNAKVKLLESNSYKYNENFQVSTKIGLEFGGVSETSGNQSIEVEYAEVGDRLGRASILFGDNIIIGENEESSGNINLTHYDLRRYDLGECSLSLVPVKVQ